MATLEQGERSVLATFPSFDQARKAQNDLKAAGFNTAQIDAVSKYPREADSSYNNPIMGRAYSLSSLTLNGDGGSTGDVGPLLASDPAVSGLAQGQDIVGGHSVLLTVVTNEERVAEAVEILQTHGAEV